MRQRNLLRGVISDQQFKSLLYGNMVGGLDMTVAKVSNDAVAWNTVTMGVFFAQCQRKWDFAAEIHDRFAPKALH